MKHSILQGQIIGRGRRAVVYLWGGYAYKVYPPDHSPQAVDFELHIQYQIARTDLPVARYYRTDWPQVIKMDYLPGITLTKRMQTEYYPHWAQDLLDLQKRVHATSGVQGLPRLGDWARPLILSSDDSAAAKTRALEYLTEMGDVDTLCHLDLHPSNIIYSGQEYFIVDWINTRLGRPVFDFARTYVILREAAPALAEIYLALVKKSIIDGEQLDKAIYVMSLLRRKEME